MSFKPHNTKREGLQGSGLSKETQALLDEAFKKRGLSLRGTEAAVHAIRGGDNGWVDTLQTGTAAFHSPASTHRTTVKVPKVGQATRKPMPGPPASFSGKRMQNAMPANEREQFIGGRPAPDRAIEKDRLAQLMELGAKGVKDLERQKAAQEAARLAAAQRRPVDPKEALIDELVSEIQERREFLEAMRAAGRAKEYEQTIRAEIQARMTRLKSLGVETGIGAEQRPSYVPLPPWQQQSH
mmetsp:Transcript_4547/g.12434  ORF Transcript_4547/g.12434 Transcript_4547/m.12434 type:complete len:240 (+) Transcript_4547:126-845(+)|eukprot:CAMPEP_0202369842 /NCGR_PEP_ID=MMETSP1127-20130417/1592_1 /ASSEMBLY_ACC=CAM_ASM_000462 /TAXON_ID=3047 /ORGANISM="Dunaliella tertiolecta, Strain CCMP1320" /LENGTH=239 /DNA_ID=CAMNT_0048965619 /DNA_START=77 /DNA_END=796 /DNA_ORIENTATION=-